MQTIELPGYYFDPDKKRYFKITTNRTSSDNDGGRFNRDSIRKHDRQQEYEKALENYQEKYEEVQNFKIVRSISLQERRKTTNREGYSESFMTDGQQREMIAVTSEEIAFPYIEDVIAFKRAHIKEDTRNRTLTRYITKNGQVLETDEDSPPNTVKVLYRIDDITDNDLIELIKIQKISNKGNLLIHMRRNETTHIFLTCSYQNQTSIITVYKKKNINISDSLCVDGKFLVFASDSKIYVDLLDPSQRSHFPNKMFPLIFKSKSQITSITSCKINSRKTRIYAATRHGQLISFVFDVNSGEQFQQERSVQSPGGLITIVSLRAGSTDGIVYISGLESKREYQTIVAFNILSLLSTTSTLLKLHSRFRNITMEKELFQLSAKSNMIYYGTINAISNATDFELFFLSKSVTCFGTFEVPLLLTSYTLNTITRDKFPSQSFKLINIDILQKRNEYEPSFAVASRHVPPILEVLVEDITNHSRHLLKLVL